MLVCRNYRDINSLFQSYGNIVVAFLRGITFGKSLITLPLVSTITIISSIIRRTTKVGLTFAVPRVSITCTIEFATPSLLLEKSGCLIDVINSFIAFIIEFLDTDGLELKMECNGVLTVYLSKIYKIYLFSSRKPSKKLLYLLL
ncbi:hypothetical protein DMUE_1940 [Dictyocoela muelleri]|nr:hypothetical protein DMUE_1940 [Dictyocoela muelleri]